MWVVYEYHVNDPFYNPSVAVYNRIMSSLLLWTNSCLVLATITWNTSFDGALIAWVLGLPFLVFIQLISKQSNIETLVKSQNKFRNGDEIQSHLRYV